MIDTAFERQMEALRRIGEARAARQAECRHEYEWVDAGPFSDDIGYKLCRFCGMQESGDAAHIAAMRRVHG